MDYAFEVAMQDIPGSVVLVAHSLGCIATALWARASRSTYRVMAALLVAPCDPEADEGNDCAAPFRTDPGGTFFFPDDGCGER